MFKLNEFDSQDSKLLEDIEDILVFGKIKQREDQSLLAFCAHLASAIPEDDTGFQQQLYEKLAASYNQKHSDQTERITPREKPAPSFISFVQHHIQDTFGISRFFRPSGNY
jgi:predicted NAD/FAD-binding protein